MRMVSRSFCVAALPGRIHHDHIRTGIPALGFLLFIEFRQHFLRFPHEKLRVSDLVQPGVAPGVLDGLGNDLHAVDLLRLLRQEQGDGADSAVEIPHRLRPVQIGVLQSQPVHHFGLRRIHLIEGNRGNLIFHVPDIVCDTGLSPDGFRLFFPGSHCCVPGCS